MQCTSNSTYEHLEILSLTSAGHGHERPKSPGLSIHSNTTTTTIMISQQMKVIIEDVPITIQHPKATITTSVSAQNYVESQYHARNSYNTQEFPSAYSCPALPTLLPTNSLCPKVQTKPPGDRDRGINLCAENAHSNVKRKGKDKSQLLGRTRRA